MKKSGYRFIIGSLENEVLINELKDDLGMDTDTAPTKSLTQESNNPEEIIFCSHGVKVDWSKLDNWEIGTNLVQLTSEVFKSMESTSSVSAYMNKIWSTWKWEINKYICKY